MSGVRRGCLAVLAVVAAGSGAMVEAAPSHAQSAGVVRAASGDPGSDWGDGAPTGSVSGRAAARAARTTTVNPAAGPDFELPFTCGQTWTGSSRAGHSPSYYAIDWNAPNDLGKPVLASAAGTVVTARSLTTSYGRYVVVDHGNGFSSLYGHMNSIVAAVGEHVDQGDLIGYVGSTGNSTGPHLHFEERLNGAYFPPYFHRATFRINSTATSANCTDRPVTGDWDGDGHTELGVFRAAPTNGYFYERSATGHLTKLSWGFAPDRPLAGDFDGDKVSQVGVRQASAGNWYLRSASCANAKVLGVGVGSDMPIVGDWDGDGRTNLGFYRGSNHTFYLRSDQGTYTTATFGLAGDRPVVGDWNGDGKDDIGVYRPSAGYWYLRTPRGSSYVLTRVQYGTPQDDPAPGDWNGDGTTDLGVWRTTTATFWLREPTSVTGRYVSALVRLGNPQ
ncbi:MAG: VCBS repeat domain-containing M23 family metallopeptidase [Marmoricola sp.]|nr:VCBS repeat domain-containing M23 family metallopeptidase [Marmoricola sp.]